jgi:hypothetical protein
MHIVVGAKTSGWSVIAGKVVLFPTEVEGDVSQKFPKSVIVT